MAKFYSSTFGAISGKHGSAVAVTRKDGVCYIRMHVIPHNPRTDKQQAHRSKIGLVSKSLAPFNPIFKHTMGVTNGISIARSHAFKHAIVDEYPNFSIDYKEIMFSFGAIEKIHNASVARNQSVMSVKWSFSEMYNCHGDDSVSFVIFNKDTKQVVHLDGVASRSDMEAQIKVYDSWADADLYLWAYVRSGDKISDSCFVGECCGDDALICTDIEIAYSDDNQPCGEAIDSEGVSRSLSGHTLTRHARDSGAKPIPTVQRLNSPNSRSHSASEVLNKTNKVMTKEKTYNLIGSDGKPYYSNVLGTLGGHKRSKIYGKFDCRAALRAIAKGGYIEHRVFFADEQTAISAGYRPCAICMPREYGEWKRKSRKA